MVLPSWFGEQSNPILFIPSKWTEFRNDRFWWSMTSQRQFFLSLLSASGVVDHVRPIAGRIRTQVSDSLWIFVRDNCLHFDCNASFSIAFQRFCLPTFTRHLVFSYGWNTEHNSLWSMSVFSNFSHYFPATLAPWCPSKAPRISKLCKTSSFYSRKPLNGESSFPSRWKCHHNHHPPTEDYLKILRKEFVRNSFLDFIFF